MQQSSRRRLLSLTLGLLGLHGLSTQLPAQGEHPFLWQISSYQGKPLAKPCWLLGTMHLGDQRLVKLHPAVRDAVDNCDAFYAELDMTKMGRMQLKLMKMMMMPKGEKLADKLPADLYQALDTELEHLGASVERFQRFKPWALTLTVSQLEAARLGMTQSLDTTLFERARRDDKDVGGLEEVMEQMQALSKSSAADQVTLLRDSVAQMRKWRIAGKAPMKLMLEAYLSGSVDRLLAFVEKSSTENGASYRLMQQMLDVRNRRMADRMHKRMQETPQSYVFAVGAMHVPGHMGLLEMLGKMGYQVERRFRPKTDMKVLQQRLKGLRAIQDKLRQAAGLKPDQATRGLETETELRSELARLQAGNARLRAKVYSAATETGK